MVFDCMRSWSGWRYSFYATARFTGFGANITLTGLQSSSSCPGLTDKHNDISIGLASVQTPCDNNKLVRRRQLFAAEEKQIKEIKN